MHCAPCLYALMTGRDEEPHGCDQVTALAVDGIRVVIVTVRWTACVAVRARRRATTLKAARAKARGLSTPTSAE